MQTDLQRVRQRRKTELLFSRSQQTGRRLSLMSKYWINNNLLVAVMWSSLSRNSCHIPFMTAPQPVRFDHIFMVRGAQTGITFPLPPDTTFLSALRQSGGLRSCRNFCSTLKRATLRLAT